MRVRWRNNRDGKGDGAPRPRLSLGALAAAPLLSASPVAAGDDGGKWSVAVYGGVGTDAGIENPPGNNSSFVDSHLLAVAVNREILRANDWVALEGEAQLVQHFGKQDHNEVNALLVLRWLPFPWDDVVETSVAVGDGVSYATAIPQIEKERSPGNNARLLNYLLVEVEMAPPGDRSWSVIARIHHRSGVFGLFDGVSLGSNFYALGMRYRF